MLTLDVTGKNNGRFSSTFIQCFAFYAYTAMGVPMKCSITMNPQVIPKERTQNTIFRKGTVLSHLGFKTAALELMLSSLFLYDVLHAR